MAISYPLQINNVGTDDYCLMSKGHHDLDNFMHQVEKDGYGDWPLGRPEHVWIKSVPCNNGEFSHYYHIVKEGTKGAFPATYTWEAYGNRRYQMSGTVA